VSGLNHGTANAARVIPPLGSNPALSATEGVGHGLPSSLENCQNVGAPGITEFDSPVFRHFRVRRGYGWPQQTVNLPLQASNNGSSNLSSPTSASVDQLGRSRYVQTVECAGSNPVRGTNILHAVIRQLGRASALRARTV
jgi:hypothetical protein